MVDVDDNAVFLLSASITSKKENILKSQSDDVALTEVIDAYLKELKKEDIEGFERHDNIRITSNGYYITVFGKDIKEVVD